MTPAKKHKWVTEAISTGDKVLSVWPSKDDVSSKAKLDKFYETIEKIGNDPRVVNVRRLDHKEKVVIYLFDIDENYEPSTN